MIMKPAITISSPVITTPPFADLLMQIHIIMLIIQANWVSISWIKIFDDDSNWDDSALKDALMATGLSAASVAIICCIVKYAPPIITWLLKEILPKVAFAV